MRRLLMITGVSVLVLSVGVTAQEAAEDGQVVYSGPAYQFEGKWSARLQTHSGTLIEILANCADPITLIASDGTTLNRGDGGSISVAPVDGSTLQWSENGAMTYVTPEFHGSFIALTARNKSGLLDPSSVVTYLRCGTIGATAAEQVCVDE